MSSTAARPGVAVRQQSTSARLFEARFVWGICAGTFIDGCATSGLALALIVFVETETSSFAQAGTVAAVSLIGSAALSPVRGRLVDAAGPRRAIAPLAGARAVALVALLLTVNARAPWGLVLVLSAFAGALAPPLYTTLRSLWTMLLDDPAAVRVGYATQSVVTEAFFVAGPLLAVPTISWLGPEAAVVALVLLSLAGSAVFLLPSAIRERNGSGGFGLAGSWRPSSGVLWLSSLALPIGAVFGSLNLALPALADRHGAPQDAGIALSALAFGGIVGGLAYGAVDWKVGPLRRLRWLLTGFAVALAPLAAVENAAAATAVLGMAGLLVAPTTATTYELVDVVAAKGRATEAFSWTIASFTAGSALGAWLAGTLARGDQLPTALALPALFVGGGLVLVLVHRP